MVKERRVERIRLDFEGKDAKKMKYIKEQRGITFNTELIRMLLTEEFKRLGGKEELL